MRTYYGAHKKATLHSLARHATSVANLGTGSNSTTSLMREDIRSPLRSSKLTHHRKKIKPVMTMKVEGYSSSSSSEDRKEKESCRFKNRNKNQKTPTTVASVIPQQRTPVKRSQKIGGFCRICFKKRQQTRKCPVVPLQVSLTIP